MKRSDAYAHASQAARGSHQSTETLFRELASGKVNESGTTAAAIADPGDLATCQTSIAAIIDILEDYGMVTKS